MDGHIFLSDIEQSLDRVFTEMSTGHGLGRPVLAWDGSSRIWVARGYDGEVFTEIYAVLHTEPETAEEAEVSTAWVDFFAKAWMPPPQGVVNQARERVASHRFYANADTAKEVQAVAEEAFGDALKETHVLRKGLSDSVSHREYLRSLTNVMRPGN